MKREYGIDVLKMATMMKVVAHHVLQGGGVEAELAKTCQLSHNEVRADRDILCR